MKVQKISGYKPHIRLAVNSDTSVAAGATEEMFNITMKGFCREITVLYDGDNTTGDPASLCVITLDGTTIKSGDISFTQVYNHFAGQTAGKGGHVDLLKYDATNKIYAVRFNINSWCHSSVRLRITNADATNAATVYAGCVYETLA